jgi:N-acyl-D-aspartate/D-glutamate deacylase
VYVLDLVIRNGTLIDGSGLPGYRADVGVSGGRIARIGRIREAAREEVDAEGHVVSPGFVDLHTHMDAQVFWDALGTNSCWHGVTSVVMGNCGFTLAPSRDGQRELVVRNLERAEDIAAEAMAAGLDWSFQTFREYLGALERLPKGINYAAQVGHSALRTYSMGERAFESAATPEELEAMKRELRDALRAGAVGFTTSRTLNHATSDDRPVASRLASWDEVCQLVDVMREEDAGVFEIANEDTSDGSFAEYFGRLRALAVRSGRPIAWGIGSNRKEPGRHKPWLAEVARTAREGGRMIPMVHSRCFSVMLSFGTRLPFDTLPVWRDVRSKPLAAQEAALRDPELRKRLIEAAKHGPYPQAIGAEARKPDWDWVWLVESGLPPYRSIAQIAASRGVEPEQAFLDVALERGLDKALFQQPFANENEAETLEMIRHPGTAVTFSDAGAHVSQICDASIPTHLLAWWVREKQALSLEEAVKKLTFDNASSWGLSERGLAREGFAADLVVFDPARVAPRLPEVVHDLPGGARRLIQRADGFRASVVNGRVVLRDGEPTGALPGRVLRQGVGA